MKPVVSGVILLFSPVKPTLYFCQWEISLHSQKPKRLNLSEQDKRALVAFMETLTDESMITDPKFADPF